MEQLQLRTGPKPVDAAVYLLYSVIFAGIFGFTIYKIMNSMVGHATQKIPISIGILIAAYFLFMAVVLLLSTLNQYRVNLLKYFGIVCALCLSVTCAVSLYVAFNKEHLERKNGVEIIIKRGTPNGAELVWL